MADDTDAVDERERDPVLAVVADPERGRRRLPYLLALLDDDDPRERLRGSLALCLAVEADPDLLEPVARRLVDRLDGDPPLEVPHALDYLAAREPEAVDAVVSDLADEREARVRRRRYRTGAGFVDTDYGDVAPGEDAVGRTRPPGGGPDGDGPRVHTDRQTDRRGPAGAETDGRGADVGAAAGGDRASDDGTDRGDREAADSENGTDEAVGGDGATGGGTTGETDAARGDADGEGRELTRGDLTAVARRLSVVTERSRFDDLTVLTDGRRDRFGDRYRAVGVEDGAQIPLSLAVFRLPDGAAEDGTFVRSFRRTMDGWTGVDDHASVLTVHDWGVRPRPWATVEYAGSSLADRDRYPLADAVATAVDVADALAHAHQYGVVHGALDPETVVYPGGLLTETDRQRPRVTAPGLATTYAEYQSLARFLDPRYAAPEHYAERYGRVDNATDVYGVGALLYRLVTGEAPYDGRPEEIRTGVCADRAPLPSEVDPDLPAALDRVVRKATAARKLTRYETVNNLRRELRGIDTDGE